MRLARPAWYGHWAGSGAVSVRVRCAGLGVEMNLAGSQPHAGAKLEAVPGIEHVLWATVGTANTSGTTGSQQASGRSHRVPPVQG